MTRLQQKNKCVVKLKSGLLVENAVLLVWIEATTLAFRGI
jgi:hypothetical protein